MRNGLLHRRDEDLAVADPAGMRGGRDRLDHPIGKAILDDHFEPHLGQEIDDIFGAAIKLGMALLAAEPLGFGDGDAGHADLVKRFLHLVELERLDDGLDLLHVILRSAAPHNNPRLPTGKHRAHVTHGGPWRPSNRKRPGPL